MFDVRNSVSHSFDVDKRLTGWLLEETLTCTLGRDDAWCCIVAICDRLDHPKVAPSIDVFTTAVWLDVRGRLYELVADDVTEIPGPTVIAEDPPTLYIVDAEPSAPEFFDRRSVESNYCAGSIKGRRPSDDDP